MQEKSAPDFNNSKEKQMGRIEGSHTHGLGAKFMNEGGKLDVWQR